MIYVVKNDALCEAINCKKDYSNQDWKVVLVDKASKFAPNQLAKGAFEVLEFNAIAPNKIDITYAAIDSDQMHHFSIYLPEEDQIDLN